MLQCKLSEGKADSFMHDVKVPPEPQRIPFTDWYLSDLVPSPQSSLFSANTTYNLSDFNMIPTTYWHLMVDDTISHKQP